MMDFIYELYQNDNFTLYLTIALVVLVILFVIVLLFGKRDQKLEETKKLQKIELEKAINEDKVEEKVEEVKEEVNVTTFVPEEETKPLFKEEENEVKVEVKDPYNTEDIEKDLNEIEKLKKEFNSMEVPKQEETVTPKKQEVFSSVFVYDEDEEEIELPTLKKTEEVKEKVPIVEEKPLLNEEEKGFNFDSIVGETYDIK